MAPLNSLFKIPTLQRSETETCLGGILETREVPVYISNMGGVNSSSRFEALQLISVCRYCTGVILLCDVVVALCFPTPFLLKLLTLVLWVDKQGTTS